MNTIFFHAQKKRGEEMKSRAAKLMEDFIECGKYPHLKKSEKKIKILTDAMKERLMASKHKRHEFKKYGLVGRFVAKKIYDTDVVGLNEYLFDIGLLLRVVEIDEKKLLQENFLLYDMIQDFRLPETFYVKPSFNKDGRALGEVRNFEVDSRWGMEDMARGLALLKPQVKRLTHEYERIKKIIANSPEVKRMERLPKDKRKSIKHKYGSLSIVANTPRYDVAAIFDRFGEDLLIEYGSPNGKKLEAFVLNGTISRKDIEMFKTVKDIRLDFAVMTIEDEKKMLEFLHEKEMTAAMNRMWV
ncbi:hypothetical protein [Parageobacillus thermoglucosidasius]|uniref:hypothetical protein n=1 Tax=Parageobacillus thermoglucosidasius TaxID=1426 RepID=UPI000B553BB6|nr:hypothetical protein [Parageobacillus thermoglucosidasius]OUM93620.1 MAG: hypothetical protein BAA00_06210 [Parageobacillus thermoglucosidasius]